MSNRPLPVTPPSVPEPDSVPIPSTPPPVDP
jgi:hypothetical protein